MIIGVVCARADVYSTKKHLEKRDYLDKRFSLHRLVSGDFFLPLKDGVAVSDEFTVAVMDDLSVLTPSKSAKSINPIQNIYRRLEERKFGKCPLISSKYELYHKLILFPESSFSSEQWQEYFNSIDNLPLFFKVFSDAFNGVYVALKTRIPQFDILRRPRLIWLYPQFNLHNFKQQIKLAPAYDNFDVSFDDIFWTSTIQNGIKYIWAPEHTMFSPGNITEKTRIISSRLPSFSQKMDEGNKEILLDLYAGIGYFVLPYLKSGKVSRVIACEWNKYSVEGLKRGLSAAGIKYGTELDNRNDTVVICEGNNDKFASMFKSRCDRVNLGLIPSSEQGWPLAVSALRSNGWMHIHMNIIEGKEDEFEKELTEKLQNLFLKRRREYWRVKVCHRERVKSFKPKVWHWVYDVYCLKQTIV